MVDTCYLHGMIDVLHYIINRSRLCIVVQITIVDTNLNDTTILGQSTELVVGQVAVVITKRSNAGVRCKDRIL